MFYTHGWVHVIAGCMFCGKTDEMLRLLRRFSIAGRTVILVKPQARHADRCGDRGVALRRPAHAPSPSTTRTRSRPPSAMPTSSPSRRASSSTSACPRSSSALAELGKQVIVTGLDRDFRGIPFGRMPRLLALADQVTKLTAICMVCGEPATRTQRLIDGVPAPGGLAAHRDRRHGRRDVRGTLPPPPRVPGEREVD